MLFLLLLLTLQLVSANPIKRARNGLLGRTGQSSQDFLVTSLPGLFDNIAEPDIPMMFAGQLELYNETNNTHYFFWSFEDQHKEPDAENKTIFWLNGGPGCSSMDGALMEAGPLRINEKQQVTYNPGSWHKKGKIVFVDQPANTGFSYSLDYDHELSDVKWHFLCFIEKYLELFPEEKTNDFILAGESYAGQYIPYIATGFLEQRPDLHLAGLLIGNGFIDPWTQGISYLPFSVEAGIMTPDHPAWHTVLNQQTKCQQLIDAARAGHNPAQIDVATRICDTVLDQILKHTADFGKASDQQCLNMYDYRLKDTYPSCGMNWPPDLKYVTPFLREDKIMDNLNLVFKYDWQECHGRVGNHLKARHSKPAIDFFPQILEKTNIVLFHGNKDIICNYKGGEFLTNALTWNGQKGFDESRPVYQWYHNGTSAGYLRSERNLTFVNVYDSSHMVPFDKPEVSRAIVDLLYKRVDYEDEDSDKPRINTHAIGHSQQEANSTLMAAPVNSTVPADGSEQLHNSNKIVRLIQLAVIVIIIWSLCALYNTYRTRPTSIIKTKPSSGRKKNVLWADQLPEDVGENKDSFLLRAMHKLKGDQRGQYAPAAQHGDIEMVARQEDDFIIASDEEER